MFRFWIQNVINAIKLTILQVLLGELKKELTMANERNLSAIIGALVKVVFIHIFPNLVNHILDYLDSVIPIDSSFLKAIIRIELLKNYLLVCIDVISFLGRCFDFGFQDFSLLFVCVHQEPELRVSV